MGGHVFISYARAGAGRAYVPKLVRRLRSVGIPVWYDEGVPPGERWEKVIRERVVTCVAFIVVMTPEAEESEWVAREILQAEVLKRPILPLLLAGKRSWRLADIQHEDVTGGRMPSAAFIARLADLTATPMVMPKPPVWRRYVIAGVLALAIATGAFVVNGPLGRGQALPAATGTPTKGASSPAPPRVDPTWLPADRSAIVATPKFGVRILTPVDGAEVNGPCLVVNGVSDLPEGRTLIIAFRSIDGAPSYPFLYAPVKDWNSAAALRNWTATLSLGTAAGQHYQIAVLVADKAMVTNHWSTPSGLAPRNLNNADTTGLVLAAFARINQLTASHNCEA